MPSKILIVDDDAVICRLLEMNLRLDGYGSASVNSGADAMATLSAERPDAAVLDLMMPGMDGWGLLEWIRGEPALAGLPVVLVSARLWGEERERGYALGVKEFLSKPFDPVDLISALRRLLGDDA